MFDVPERLGGTQFACHFIVSDGDSLSNIQDRLEREARAGLVRGPDSFAAW